MIESLSPQTLRGWLAETRPCRLLDVREEAEWKIARLPGAEWRPLSRLSSWLPRLLEEQDARPLVIYCHHGMRSAQVCALLGTHGVQQVWNLSGGIERWSQEIDPSVPRY